MGSRTQFERLEELYHRLAAAGEAERRALLERCRREDAELAAAAERLIEADAGDAEQRLLSAVVGETEAVTELPECLGPYRLLRKLGEGGMGVVYEAEQAEPIHRRVAIKLVRRRLFTAAALARFDDERQSLALMTHPGIAQVYDAGETGLDVSGSSQPYVVMELVEGPPITDYCDDKALDLEARLELFLEVCEAVQHAHQKGVIHRDLKPSNILISEQEGRARPKVIDFGIAKAINLAAASAPDRPLGLEASERAVESRHTRAGEVVGTLEAMSPEQIRGLPVDTRSDVYSLGVLLYELLVGEPPFVRSDGPDAVTTLRQQIVETPPDRPSDRLPSPRARGIAKRHGASTIRAFRRQLGEDLDWIALRALAKEPEQRYDSVARLGDDVRRYLTSRPVGARPTTFGFRSSVYRARKFFRRNRVASLAGLAVSLAIVVGSTTSFWLYLQAETAAARARREAEVSGQAFDFMANLFAAAQPSSGRSLSARDLVDQAKERLLASTGLEPEVRAQLLAQVGFIYAHFDEAVEGAALLEEAVGLLRTSDRDQNRRALVSALHGLADTRQTLGDLDGATRLLREAIDVEEGLSGTESPRTVQLLVSLGLVLRRARHVDEALAIHRRAHDLAGRLEIDRGEVSSVAANSLAQTLLAAGQDEEALGVLERAIGEARQAKATGATWVDVRLPPLLNNAGSIFQRRGQLSRTVAYQSEALELLRSVYGPDRLEQHFLLVNLGVSAARRGFFEEAKERLEQAATIVEKWAGTSTPYMAIVHSELGALARKRGDPDVARRHLVRALEIAESVPPAAPHGSPVRLHWELAQVERQAGQMAAFLRHLRQGLDVAEEWRSFDALGVCLLHLESALATAAGAAEAKGAGRQAAAREYRSAREVCGDKWEDPLSLYARGRYQVAAGESGEALALLADAAQAGYRDVWPRYDPDLAPLRQVSELAALLSRLDPQ